MAVNDPKLKIDITADSSQARRAVSGLYNDVNKLGGGFTSAFGGAIPMAGAAAAAITGIATAVIGVGSAIFDMTKAASEYGSAIFDATEKTGLSAEVMSSFKVAADQSGSSLEVVTGGLAKFAKTIGAAGDGSEEAQKKLAKIGVTSNDLETALGQALKTIAKYPPGVQQMTAAQAAFGKSGADLLPFIKSFDGDLPALVAKMKEYGVTMSNQAVKTTDEFGDTLDTLTTQAAGVGRQFAVQLMPAVTSAMKAISGVITNNQSAVHIWGSSVGEAVRGVQTVFALLDGQVQLSFKAINYLFGVNMQATVNWAQFIFDTALPVLKLLREIATVGGGISDSIATATGTATSIVSRGNVKFPDMPDLGGGGKGKAGKSGESDADKAAREAEERRRKAVQAAEKEMQQTLAIYSAGYKERIANLDQALANGEIVELQHVRDTARVRLEAVMDEITLNKQLSENQNLNDEERAEIMQRIKVLTIELRVEKLKGATEATEQIKKEVKGQTELLEVERKRLDAIKKIRMQKKADADAERIQELRRKRNRGGDGYDFGLGGSFKEFTDQVLTNGPKMEEVLQSLGQIGAGAFNSLAQGMGSMIESWVLMGDMGPKAMQKLVASVLAGVAAQSAVLAIFELAKGFAALWLNPAEAATHFKAAALFGVVAVGAALAGRAVAGNAFKPESNQSSSSNGSNNSSSSENMNPYSRASATAFYSGQNNAVVQLSNEVARLRKTISSQTPGNILVAGAREKRGFFGNQVATDIAGNAAVGVKIARNIGMR